MSINQQANISTTNEPYIKQIFLDAIMAIGHIDKVNPQTTLRYVGNKIANIKNKISPREYLMAEKAAQYRCEQVGSFDFLNHPMASISNSIGHTFIEAKVAAIDDNNQNIQEDLFKGFLTFYIIQAIIERKKNSTIRQIVMINGDYNLPDLVVRAAKSSNINPKSIHVYKSGVLIDLEQDTIERKDGYQKLWVEIPLDGETHNHTIQPKNEEEYTTGSDGQIYDNTGKSIGITGVSGHPDPVGEQGKPGIDGVDQQIEGPTGNVGPDDSGLFGKQE